MWQRVRPYLRPTLIHVLLPAMVALITTFVAVRTNLVGARSDNAAETATAKPSKGQKVAVPTKTAAKKPAARQAPKKR